jgi:hypothetical protein
MQLTAAIAHEAEHFPCSLKLPITPLSFQFKISTYSNSIYFSITYYGSTS